ncbi:LacI family DNA-binding transcriptional regulator [Paenibacillus validus]|uniref:Substrate-binding domain-containing protein n=1 Tax=Paenibacillus validus TaxID=44253 RepID=A0A7X3CTR6_9BACL|nr:MULTISPECIES: LacI family DNA-binding transcriptional regulator [Paenibacillus]MED4600123.1 LacI family DNA-binding transcriptional regulator [Paenibacillus validus]MED4607705.1 LacI family DNA-binding transcriptional regulator [Paenibacillus validus]MUG73090.1 substrate-binding domain-containing protein [Paenibacillus validus]
MSNVTIKDIARMAGVSHTTVSRALNDSPLINPETKEKIKSIAGSLNYTPNYSAKSLVLDRSYNLGLFFTTLRQGTSPGFLYEAIKGVNEIIKDRYNLIVRGIDDYKSYHHVNRKSFDGIMLMSQSAADQPFIEYASDHGIPFIVLNREVEMSGVVNLIPDDQSGAYRMTEYMLRCGHRRIAIVEGKAGFKSAQARKEGYREALLAYGIPLQDELCIRGDYGLESGYKAMVRLLALPERPTAVFCSSDDMALGAVKAAVERGLRVPDDVSVAGFDDTGYSAFTTPALTTVRRPIEEMSRAGAERLMALLETKESAERKTLFHTELIVRDSVKRLNTE